MDSEEVPQKCAKLFPEDNVPSPRTIQHVYQRLISTLTFCPGERKQCHPVTSAQSSMPKRVVKRVAKDTHVSLCQISHETGATRASAWRLLHAKKFHPYHISLHQALLPSDFSKRADFCNSFLNSESDSCRVVK